MPPQGGTQRRKGGGPKRNEQVVNHWSAHPPVWDFSILYAFVPSQSPTGFKLGRLIPNVHEERPVKFDGPRCSGKTNGIQDRIDTLATRCSRQPRGGWSYPKTRRFLRRRRRRSSPPTRSPRRPRGGMAETPDLTLAGTEEGMAFPPRSTPTAAEEAMTSIPTGPKLAAAKGRAPH